MVTRLLELIKVPDSTPVDRFVFHSLFWIVVLMVTELINLFIQVGEVRIQRVRLRFLVGWGLFSPCKRSYCRNLPQVGTTHRNMMMNKVGVICYSF